MHAITNRIMYQRAKGIIIQEKIVCERLVRLVCSHAEKICFISWLFDIIFIVLHKLLETFTHESGMYVWVVNIIMEQNIKNSMVVTMQAKGNC